MIPNGRNVLAQAVTASQGRPTVLRTTVVPNFEMVRFDTGEVVTIRALVLHEVGGPPRDRPLAVVDDASGELVFGTQVGDTFLFMSGSNMWPQDA